MIWEPIETAPTDGTPILIFDPTQPDHSELDGRQFDDPRYAIGYWRVWKNSGRWMWGNRNCSECSPTHWMWLPHPPKEPTHA